MPSVEVVGQHLSGPRNETGTRTYRVDGVSTAGSAYALAWAFADPLWEGLIKETLDIEELGGNQWDAVVKYGTTEPGDVGDTSWSFQIATESIRITQAVDHIQDFPLGSPNHQGAINVRNDGNGLTIEGVDVRVPVFSWEETHHVPYSLITPIYLQTLEATVARTNKEAFRIWQAEELLLLGVSGSGNNKMETPIALTFQFAASRTRLNFSIGGISGVNKTGHHYLWLEYEKDVYSNRLLNKPLAAHTERVYRMADYGQLGLYDPWNR